MAGITLAQAEAQLVSWIAANTAVSGGQEYEIEDGGMRRRLKRTDTAQILEQIKFWDAKVKELTPASAGGRRRTRYVVTE